MATNTHLNLSIHIKKKTTTKSRIRADCGIIIYPILFLQIRIIQETGYERHYFIYRLNSQIKRGLLFTHPWVHTTFPVLIKTVNFNRLLLQTCDFKHLQYTQNIMEMELSLLPGDPVKILSVLANPCGMWTDQGRLIFSHWWASILLKSFIFRGCSSWQRRASASD